MSEINITQLTMDRIKEEWAAPLKARIAQLEAALQAISQDEFRDEWKLSEEYIDDDYWRIVNIARVALTSAPETKAEYDAKDHRNEHGRE